MPNGSATAIPLSLGWRKKRKMASKVGAYGHASQKLACHRLPPYFIHEAYNVSYATGVVAPKVVKINNTKTAPYIHLESISPHLYWPQIVSPLFEC